MGVTLAKLSDRSPFGGNHSEYTKRRDGTIPEYALSWRRHERGARVSAEQSSGLRDNSLTALSMFFAGRL
mgnify:CR=1 FL=1